MAAQQRDPPQTAERGVLLESLRSGTAIYGSSAAPGRPHCGCSYKTACAHTALPSASGPESSQSVLLGRETEAGDASLGEEPALDVTENGLRGVGSGAEGGGEVRGSVGDHRSGAIVLD